MLTALLLQRRRISALVRTILSPFFTTPNGSLVAKSCDYLYTNGYEGMYNSLGCAEDPNNGYKQTMYFTSPHG